MMKKVGISVRFLFGEVRSIIYLMFKAAYVLVIEFKQFYHIGFIHVFIYYLLFFLWYLFIEEQFITYFY